VPLDGSMHSSRQDGTMKQGLRRLAALVAALGAVMTATGRAQTPAVAATVTAPRQAAAAARSAAVVTPPSDYVIGPEDVLGVVFWREKDMSVDVVVRPDGKISLPLLNDVQAAGFTPDQLRERVQADAGRYFEDPNASIIVKQINSRRIFITGEIAKPGPYPIVAPTTVLQLIAMAGGLNEFADAEHIIIWRNNDVGQQVSYAFNYKAVSRRRNLQQNIALKPGDTVVVP
jgi:polysaccharide export outer membrane protein